MVHTCERLGALLFPIGITDPAQALSLLREQRRIPGKKERVSILVTYPSYLGQLVEEGLRLGYGPDDFGLERIMSGGELVTAGLRRRCAALFGPVAFSEGYAMTEILPLGGNLCNQGHLHYEISEGLMEVIDPDTGRPAAPGEPGTLVATPFPPYRETTILLRYDTQDMVRTIAGPLTCSMATMPATTNILGKQSLCVRHDQGWTFPRDVVEALEAVPEVPLPARYGFWAVPGGVALDVLVREITPAAYTQIVASLTAHGVLVQELELTTNRTEIRQPYPLRCDLKESTFASAPPPAHPIRESATEVRP